MDRRPRAAPPRRALVSRGAEGAPGALVALRRAARPDRLGRRLRRGGKKGRFRPLLRTAPFPRRAGDPPGPWSRLRAAATNRRPRLRHGRGGRGVGPVGRRRDRGLGSGAKRLGGHGGARHLCGARAAGAGFDRRPPGRAPPGRGRRHSPRLGRQRAGSRGARRPPAAPSRRGGARGPGPRRGADRLAPGALVVGLGGRLRGGGRAGRSLALPVVPPAPPRTPRQGGRPRPPDTDGALALPPGPAG